MATTRSKTTAVSAPGKVLLAGGYLVLDREHTGLVFGLDARICCVISSSPSDSKVGTGEVLVESPQFLGAEWRFGVDVEVGADGEAEGKGVVRVRQLGG